MNYSAIISSFLLAGGVVMILISQQGDSFDDEGNVLSQSSVVIVLTVGIALTVVGFIGFTLTIIAVLRRADRRLRKGEKRKLEKEVQSKTASVAASRRVTNTSRLPSIVVSTSSTPLPV